jgi:hypothetical protein
MLRLWDRNGSRFGEIIRSRVGATVTRLVSIYQLQAWGVFCTRSRKWNFGTQLVTGFRRYCSVPTGSGLLTGRLTAEERSLNVGMRCSYPRRRAEIAFRHLSTWSSLAPHARAIAIFMSPTKPAARLSGR